MMKAATLEDITQLRISTIRDHITRTSETIKRYRAQAKEMNAAAAELAKGNAKLRRELKRAESDNLDAPKTHVRPAIT